LFLGSAAESEQGESGDDASADASPASSQTTRRDPGSKSRKAGADRADDGAAIAKVVPVDDEPASPQPDLAASKATAADAGPRVDGGPAEKRAGAAVAGGKSSVRPDSFGKRSPPDGAPVKPAVGAEAPVGQIAGPRSVLLRFDLDDSSWHRIAVDAALRPGDTLISPPGFRPEFVLPGKLRLAMIDGASLVILAAGADGAANVASEFGRFLLHAEDPAGARIRWKFGDRVGSLALAEDSLVALEVARTAALGADPETQPGPVVVDLYMLSGKCEWQDDAEAKPHPLEGRVRLTLGDQPAETVALQTRPRWTAADGIAPLDQRGAGPIEHDLPPGKPAGLRLRELGGHPKKEIRGLALRTMALLGDVEPLIEPLELGEEKSIWTDCILQLKAAVVRGPHSAAAVRGAMEKLYGPQGANLYALLWKYGPNSKPEELADLVRNLDHQRLAFRVVSIWSLRGITGLNLPYRPEDPPVRRRAAIQKWREKLNLPRPAD
jgi:hypothetical protein